MAKIRTMSVDEMRDMLLLGMTYKEISQRVGISRQRVEQLLSPPKHIMAKVKERARETCEDCGIILTHGAHLHHVNSDTIDPVQYNGIENISYLCPGCHRRRHT